MTSNNYVLYYLNCSNRPDSMAGIPLYLIQRMLLAINAAARLILFCHDV